MTRTVGSTRSGGQPCSGQPPRGQPCGRRWARRLLHAVTAACLGIGFASAPAPAAQQPPGEEIAEAFRSALASFRAGDNGARDPLFRAARRVTASSGRGDALRIATFYDGLQAPDRARGLALEREFDRLRNSIAELDAVPDPGSAGPDGVDARRHAREELDAWLRSAVDAADPVPAAYGLSLLARLEVRELEAAGSGLSGRRMRRPSARARDSIERFERAGIRTPQLEPRWMLARLALAAGDPDAAEEHFASMAELAHDVARPLWRERAVLGLIGIARQRGDLFEAQRALRLLATFREPATSWALAREVAVQRLAEDDVARATEWLGRYPPSESDEELAGEDALAEAWDEWRALVAAAQLRAGRALLPAMEHAREADPATAGSSASVREVLRLAGVALAIESGDATAALAMLAELRTGEGGDQSALGQVEALTLEGRALLTLGRAADAIAPLEEALALSAARDRADALRTGSRRTSSRVGEWLGLTSVEWLARAYADVGDPLRAAGLIESVHSGHRGGTAATDAHELHSVRTGDRLAAIAAETDLGVVTWVVGADASLAVHVHPDGTATAQRIPRGRRSIGRAADRLRSSLLATRDGRSDAASFDGLAADIARTLLPRTLVRSIAGLDAPSPASREHGATLVLLPHGALERVPFEALPVELSADGRASRLGLAVALAVGDRLATERHALAPPFDPIRTRWRALGAPVGTAWPELGSAGLELRVLATLHRGMRIERAESFTRDALLDALGSSDALHLATHAIHAEGPGLGGTIAILTSGGEFVTAEELAALRPALPLAVLATCESGDGPSVEGRGVLGLGQALLDGGTRAVVVTLWPVDDLATYRASTVLHGALQAGVPAVEALRRARVALAHSGASCAEWAAYRLMRRP